MGLAQLYQMRGRVGRGARLGYAYLTFMRDKVLSDIAEKRLYLLEEGGKIISAFVLEKSSDGEDCVLWKNPSARAFYLMRFGVNPEYTRRGFGVLSLQYAKKIAKLLCGEYLRLFVAEKNIPAIRLYEKCGFSPADGIFQNEIAPGKFLPELGYELYLE